MICVVSCRTFDSGEIHLTEQVDSIFCEIGTPIAISLTPPTFSVSEDVLPRPVFPAGAVLVLSNDTYRVRLDACVTDDDALILQRIVIGHKPDGVGNKPGFYEYWIGDDDIVQGLGAAILEQDHEHLLIVERDTNLSQLETERFRIEGLRVGDKTFVAASDTLAKAIKGSLVFIGTLEVGDPLESWTQVSGTK